MKIITNKIQKALGVYNNQRMDKNEKDIKKTGKKDELKLSKEAMDFQVAMKTLKDTPDMRAEKIAEIKGQIEYGTYKIDSKKIVDKMLKDINMDK